jgi:predicted TIM-barrel fold metal-dependent hydrolase
MAEAWDCHVHVFSRAAPAHGAHYTPADRPLADIEALGREHGVSRLVLVQPSVYGHDNGLLLKALAERPGLHRGVVVATGLDAALIPWDDWHAAGVRGVRINRVSPVGAPGLQADELRLWSPALRRLGWHVQWYVQPPHLPELVALQGELELPFVLDHVAGLGGAIDPKSPELQALATLSELGAWIKLSGWYRLGLALDAPQAWPDAMAMTLHWLAERFTSRMLWASDWPHTSYASPTQLRYESTMQPARLALGEAHWHDALYEAPSRLYR